jgi:hypothetical protein
MGLIGHRLDCPCCQEWPKTIYPHGAGRTWSTECHDDWKREVGVEVVPAIGYRGVVEALKEICDRLDPFVKGGEPAAEDAVDVHEIAARALDRLGEHQ